MKNIYLTISLVLCIFSCNNQSTKNIIQKTQNYYSDSLYNEAIKSDSLEHIDITETMFYIKSGYILSEKDKNAISVNRTDVDSIYLVYLYGINDNEIQIEDSLFVGDILPVHLSLEFKDFNFDGQKDIYLQGFVSNGLALSSGYLILIDKPNKKMKEYKEARSFNNLSVDSEQKLILSDRIIYCLEGRDLCKLEYKWNNEKLILIRVKCPCETME